jgi:uncharacterized protein YdeI (YjbR/CyaY-like superfamily)
MTPAFFAKQSGFRKWLVANYKKKKELLVGFYKVNSNKPGMTWPQSVDEAICFGWIDGVRKSIDKNSYCIRFTPRKTSSIWSAINIKKVKGLIKRGLMQPAGLELFKNRNPERSNVYSFENATKKLSPSFENQFKKNKIAWGFFTTQAPSYQKTIIHWIVTAKKETTQNSRLNKAITESRQQKRIF